ncbi:primosomal protein N' [Paenibacillus sp. N1-5-1-14]|uniref:primosomal protein N' n=1 Tax=Paenibacillus radicibacter TaxID=2972488 RepID=UPI002158A746|nr:primosomal protein N' [Paenibacillus radicibacter]MCR8641714.1 primosomal protein N' [Paenibacillus radicibacter]
MFAKVIVDVPAKGTSRGFDYIVPDDLLSVVEVGSRVEVPFGPRVLQGYVVEVGLHADYNVKKMKPIRRILDMEPPLTEELVKLGYWMSTKYLCREAAALSVMVPSALKAKSERYLVVSNQVGEDASKGLVAAYSGGQADYARGGLLPFFDRDEIIQYLQKKGKDTLDNVLQKFPQSAADIKSMLAEGVLEEVQSVKDRLSVKTRLTVFPLLTEDELVEAAAKLSGQAVKQKEVLLYLAEHMQPIAVTELNTHIPGSSGAVKSLASKGFVELREMEVLRDPYADRDFKRTEPLDLRDEQQIAYEAIRSSLDTSSHQTFLLHGVTGSGKTEVYLQTIQHCLDLGREAIVLVPEISLTPQMVERFKGRFGDLVAVLHSRLSHGERYDEWRKITRGTVKVAIGARSAVFAPFKNVGLIIIDEEHETSYKQEETPKYHARDVAIKRAMLSQGVVILGSATPSLESIHETLYRADGTGRYELLTMNKRASGGSLPEVHIVDMREELKNGNRSMFSSGLYQALLDRLRKNEQSIFLLNRRGYATFVMCRGCGYVGQCPHCDISLTYHQTSHMMRCHYCGYAEREPKVCPSCSSEHIRHFGTGTQRVEEELVKLFPGIRVIRMDVDTTTEKGSHEKLLTRFRNQQADVLLGTQMVAKGLDFPNVTLVGVIAADTVLGLPDFRSAERTFQLLTQVAGRAGRHVLPGEVYVQTYMPEHYAVTASSEHDYGAFARTELSVRGERGYPPYSKMMLITFSHQEVQPLIRCAEAFVAELRKVARLAEMRAGHEGGAIYGSPQGVHEVLSVLGPVASPLARIKDRYRFQCMVKYWEGSLASELVAQVVETFEEPFSKAKLLVSVDVDPQFLM